MVRPKTYKLKCTQCSYQKIVHPKSDVFPSCEDLQICKKCSHLMIKKDLYLIEKLFYNSLI